MGYLSHGFFDQPPRRSSDMDDSVIQFDDDNNDMQDLESNNPFWQVVGMSEVQPIGMYANQSRLYVYIYT
jgi:hypothetical protein